jgi:nitrogen fixation NifU-like protein
MSSGELWDHVEAPSRRGPLVNVTHQGLAVNPLCGDEVEIQLRLGAERQIQQAAFTGRGCAVSQGAASLICERVEGVDVATVLALSSAQVLSWMGVTLSPIRQRCALLAFEALTQALSTRTAKPVRLVILGRVAGAPLEPKRHPGVHADWAIPKSRRPLAPVNGEKMRNRNETRN